MNNRLDKLMLTDQNFTMCLHCLMNFHVACDLFTNCITIVTKNAFCKVVLADKNFLEKQKKKEVANQWDPLCFNIIVWLSTRENKPGFSIGE